MRTSTYLTFLIFRSNRVYDDNRQLITKTLLFTTKRSRTKLTIIIYILSKIYKNLISKKSCTAR